MNNIINNNYFSISFYTTITISSIICNIYLINKFINQKNKFINQKNKFTQTYYITNQNSTQTDNDNDNDNFFEKLNLSLQNDEFNIINNPKKYRWFFI